MALHDTDVGTALIAAWANDTPCRHAPLLFFAPESPESPAQCQRREQAAIAVCDSCPVRGRCLETALMTRQSDGIWGGLTPQDRHRMTAAAGQALLARLHLPGRAGGRCARD